MDQLNLAKLYMNKSIFRKKYPILRGPKQTQTWRMIRKEIQNVIELSRALYMEKTPTLQQHEVLCCPTLQPEPHGSEIRHNQTWLDYHSLYTLHLVQPGCVSDPPEMSIHMRTSTLHIHCCVKWMSDCLLWSSGLQPPDTEVGLCLMIWGAFNSSYFFMAPAVSSAISILDRWG